MFFKGILGRKFNSAIRGPMFGRVPRFSYTTHLVVPGKEKLVGGWLFLTAAGVLGLIVLGGYTRLTRSSLSMLEWNPYTKTYPKNEEEWTTEFDKYKKCVQNRATNQSMSLQAFKSIYQVEFLHRKMGMLLGYFFLLPFGFFQFRGYLQHKMTHRLLALLGLGGLHGFMGWWTGKRLVEKPQGGNTPRLSPYKLTTHLLLATAIYSGLLWHSFTLLIKPVNLGLEEAVKLKYLRHIRVIGIFMVSSVFLSILSGALVAGIDAGRMYNTWPLMNGQVVPSGITEQSPLWKNFFENVPMVQFNHRNIAYATELMSLVLLRSIFKGRMGGPVTVAGLLVAVMVNYQAISGIFMLLDLVPREKASIHQMTAMLTLSCVLLMIFLARVPKVPL